MITTVLLWGLAAGIVHFVVIGILYGNPLTDRISAGAEAESPAVRKWLLENTGLLRRVSIRRKHTAYSTTGSQ